MPLKNCSTCKTLHEYQWGKSCRYSKDTHPGFIQPEISKTSVDGYLCSNYHSVLFDDSAEFINNLILQEILDKKFVLADHTPLCVHALGAVRKKKGGYRPITDCKRPLHRSINNYMDETFKPFKYKSSDDVCNLMSPFCYMATVNISSAYRSVSISPQDWEYQGISICKS